MDCLNCQSPVAARYIQSTNGPIVAPDAILCRFCLIHSLDGWMEHDGGRAAAGYKGHTKDCAIRAIAIAAELPYQQVYDDLHALAKKHERIGKNFRKRSRSSARSGFRHTTVARYLTALGWQKTATMAIGSGTKVHLDPQELPAGRLIVQVTHHYTAVIDGLILDTHDPRHEGRRAVYSYWSKPAIQETALEKEAARLATTRWPFPSADDNPMEALRLAVGSLIDVVDELTLAAHNRTIVDAEFAELVHDVFRKHKLDLGFTE